MSYSSDFFGGGKPKSQTFTASGTFTVPAGVQFVIVDMVGGGAGGSGGGVSGYNGYGGGSAMAIMGKRIAVTPGASMSVTIGAAGTAGTKSTTTSYGAVAPGDGGDTTFGGLTAKGGRALGATTHPPVTRQGYSAAGPDLAGPSGSAPIISRDPSVIRGGGTYANDIGESSGAFAGGAKGGGGQTYEGGGGSASAMGPGGAGGNSAATGAAQNGGAPASGYGGGGGGGGACAAGSGGSNSGGDGGAGKPGCVVIYWSA